MEIIEQIKAKELTVIGKDIILKGEFHLSGDIRINGRLEGTVFYHGQGSIIIEKDGLVFGNVFADTLEVWGKVEGNIEAKETFIVRSGGQIDGEFKAKNIAIYPGAIVNIKGQTSL